MALPPVDKIVELLSLDPSQPMSRGTLRAYVRQLGPWDTMDEYHWHRLLEGLLQAEARPDLPALAHVPWSAIPPRSSMQAPKELTGSDQLYLSRLPTDPAQVTPEQAVEVFKMFRDCDFNNESDARLLNSIFTPIEQHFQQIADKANERARAEAARWPIPAVPKGAVDVLEAAIVLEVPELNSYEARARAEVLVREANEARKATGQLVSAA